MSDVLGEKQKILKVNVCGLEVPREVIWTNWKVGKEYYKNVMIKNPTYEPRKVKIRMPPSKVFKMSHIKKMFIAPGNAFNVTILFIPEEDVEYVGSLEIKNELGCFCISLLALLTHAAQLELKIPQHIDMGICAVGHMTYATFQICNVSTVDTDVSIDSLPPIHIEPLQFSLRGGQSVSLNAIFKPFMAKTYNVNVVVYYGKQLEMSSCINFLGRGKFALMFAFMCSKSCCVAPQNRTKCPEPITNLCNCNNHSDATNNNHNNNNVIAYDDSSDNDVIGRGKSCSKISIGKTKTDIDDIIKSNSKLRSRSSMSKKSNTKIQNTYSKCLNKSDHNNNISNNINNTNANKNACHDNATVAIDDDDNNPCSQGKVKVLLDFGEVSAGCRSKKHVIVKNMSLVESYYSLSIPHAGCDQQGCGDDDDCEVHKIFSFERGEGYLKAGCYQEVSIIFHPKETGMTYRVDVMLQSCSGLNSVHGSRTTNQIFPRTAMTCVGRCAAPKVFLCRRVLCFPAIELPGYVTKQFGIINQSSCSTYFQFQIDNKNSTFQIEPPSGELSPLSTTIINVTFHPKVPFNYYRRVTCMVHHKGVIYLHLLGTCTGGDMIPVTLNECHLIRYECFCKEKLSFLAPQQLSLMVDKGYHGKECISDVEESRKRSKNEEFMDDGYTTNMSNCMPHISTDVNFINFGNLEVGCSPVQKELCLTNHTRGPIVVQWINCHEFKEFSVVPSRKVIGAEQSAMFTFSFKATKQNQFYSSEFECFATHEKFINYKTTDERILMPPWCVTVTLGGDTFGFGCERFHPVLKIDRPSLHLRSLGKHTPAFETVRIFNAGKDPAVFDIEKDLTGMFLHKPSWGLVQPGTNQIIMFMFNSQVLDYYWSLKIDRSLVMNINDQANNNKQIAIKASINRPLVIFGSEGRLNMRATCTGLHSSTRETITSTCCTPLHFKWIVPVAYEKLLHVEPMEGFLGPYETQMHTWFFRSVHYEDKLIKVKLQTKLVPPKNDDDDDDDDAGGCGCHDDVETSDFNLNIFTRGTRATLTCKNDRVKLGPLLVGQRHSCYLTEISNDFDCDVIYRLHVMEEVATPTTSSSCHHNDGDDNDNDGGDEDDENGDGGDDYNYCHEERTQFKYSRSPAVLRILPHQGHLPARTKRVLRTIIDSIDRRHYRWNVSFTLHDSQGNELTQQPEQRIFHVLANGIIPELSLADICTGGSAKCISRSYLWRMFSVDRFNTKIKCDVGNNMKRFSQSQMSSVDFHFPAGPIGIKPCVIILVFKNCGLIPCDWKIFLPSELKVEVDKWAESGEMTEEEYNEMLIVDNKLFTISPGRGRLNVDQSCCVTFTFTHLIVGSHVLPVILRVKNGNEVKVNLCGLTVNRDTPHLHFPLKEFKLEPVYLGACHGPIQSFEVFNSGSVDVDFTIDSSNLDCLAKANYDHRVMECFTTSGRIKAGEMGIVDVRLNPIEAKMYSVDLTIKVEGGDCYPISFTGEGKDYRCRTSKSDQTCSSVSNSSIPDQQICTGPEQICRLSVNQLDFGDLPILCTVKRLVSLTNCSVQHAASYRWNVKNQCHAQIVKVEPSSGCLDPGNSVMLKVTLRSGCVSSIIEVDLICEISNMTEQRMYDDAMYCYADACNRIATEVDFSEVDHCQDLNCPRMVECQGHPYANELKEELKFPKYKTLPPIIRTDPATTNTRVAKKTKRNYIERPKTPTPIILFLSIRAKTHNLSDHKILFPECYNTFFIDRCIGARGDGDDAGLQFTPQQYEVISEIFSSLLRDLLDDEAFVSSCAEIACEPMPFFQQFKKEENEVGERDPCKPITNIRKDDEEQPDKQAPHENFGNQDEQKLMERDEMKKSPGFGILSEGIFEETIYKIVEEAFYGEFSITARPRLVALGHAKDRPPMTGCEQSHDQ